MNEIETRDKGLLLCQNLLDKGVLSQTDFEACSQIYLPSTGISRAVAGAVQGIPDAKTSAEISFGMSAKQGKDELGYDVSKRPSYTAFFRLVNSDMYYRQTNRKGVVDAEGTFSEKLPENSSAAGDADDEDKSPIYMTIRPGTGLLYLTPVDTNAADAAINSVFVVELRQDGNYTIQNQATKYYLRVGVDPATKELLLIADNSELTSECLFKQMPLDGGKYEFESVAKPGNYLSAVKDDGLVIGLGGSREGRVWELEFLGGTDGLGEMTSEDAYDTAEAKAIINSVLDDVKAARSKYYTAITTLLYIK